MNSPLIEQLLHLEVQSVDREITQLQLEKSILDNRLHRLTEHRAAILGSHALRIVEEKT